MNAILELDPTDLSTMTHMANGTDTADPDADTQDLSKYTGAYRSTQTARGADPSYHLAYHDVTMDADEAPGGKSNDTGSADAILRPATNEVETDDQTDGDATDYDGDAETDDASTEAAGSQSTADTGNEADDDFYPEVTNGG